MYVTIGVVASSGAMGTNLEAFSRNTAQKRNGRLQEGQEESWRKRSFQRLSRSRGETMQEVATRGTVRFAIPATMVGEPDRENRGLSGLG